MTYFTSWDVNTFLCLIYWGLPGDVVKRMMKVTKKTHEEFSFSEALSYWTTNSPSLVRWRLTQPLERRGVSLKFQMNSTLEFQYTRIHVFKRRLNLTKEFKQEWRQRSIEDRKDKVVEWCKHGDSYEQSRHQRRLKNIQGKIHDSYIDNLWQSWEAWGYTVNTPEYMNDATYRGRFPWDRRANTSRWYEGIHPGRFFLFYKGNKIIQERNRGVPRGPCEDGYKYPRTPIFDWGPYEQLIEDLRCIDGPGIGESAGSKIEHIDDIFLD